MIPLHELDKIVTALRASPSMRFEESAQAPTSLAFMQFQQPLANAFTPANPITYATASCGNHWKTGGKGAGSDLIQKVQDRGGAADRTSAKDWMETNCVFRCIVVPDDEMRHWVQVRLLSELQPSWGR